MVKGQGHPLRSTVKNTNLRELISFKKGDNYSILNIATLDIWHACVSHGAAHFEWSITVTVVAFNYLLLKIEIC